MHDFYFLHYSIIYFLKLFHGTCVQILIVRKKRQWSNFNLAWKNIIMSAWLWVLLLVFHQISFFLSVITTKAWLQWLAELEMDSSPRNCGSDPMVNRCLQNCESWVTSIEFPKARLLLPTVEWRKWKIALTTLRNPALFVKYDNYF